MNKKKSKFILNFFLFYFNFYFKNNCIYKLLKYLFFFYNKKINNYFSFISKMNSYFIDKNTFSSLDFLFLFYYRYNLLCRSLINFYFKYKSNFSLLVYPLEYENILNGRNKNSFIGRR